MSVSLQTSANFIMKLHLSLLENKSDNISLYPVMDGAYVTAEKSNVIKSYINDVMRRLADEFIHTEENLHRFLVRGGLAYGPVIHGKSITKECNDLIADNQEYVKYLLLGMPIIRANRAEKSAPPFGIFCDETLQIADGTFSYRWYDWWLSYNSVEDLKNAIKSYFTFYEYRSSRYDYSKDSLEKHKKMNEQYFADVESNKKKGK